MALKEVIQKDGQRHLYAKSAITSGLTQYIRTHACLFIAYKYYNLHTWTERVLIQGDGNSYIKLY